MSAGGEITDVQWDAARVAFMDSLDAKEGLLECKYEQIVDVLQTWDQCSPAERREKAAGNQAYWSKKYALSTVGDRVELLMRENTPEAPVEGSQEVADVTITAAMKRCSHQNRMFDDIKAVHVESELHPSRVPLSMLCCPCCHLQCASLQRIMPRM